MRIAICDDDRDFLKDMEQLLERIEKSLDITIVCYSAGEKLLEDCREKKQCYDVVFMDIELEGMDGITLGKKLRELNEELLLIFLTSHADYAIKGYEARAFRYLLKPVDESIIRGIFAEIKQERSKRQVLHITVDGSELLLPLQKILFLDAEGKYTTIYLEDKKYLTRTSLNDYEKQLDSKGFFRIHRKYLVNMANISQWNGHQINVGGHLLPISQRKEKEFRNQLYGYLEKGIQE